MKAKISAIVGLVLIGLWVALYLATTRIVCTNKLPGIIASFTKDVTVSYSKASGTAFSSFTFENLEVRGEDSNVIWVTRFEKARLKPSVWRLARRLFHTSLLEGHGFEFELSFKKKKNDEADDPNGYKDNMRVVVDNIHLTNVKSIKIGTHTYFGSGKTELHSHFYLWPEYELRIGTSRFFATEKNWQADFKFELGKTVTRETPGLSIFKKLKADLEFKGSVDRIERLSRKMKSKASWMPVVQAGAATIDAKLVLDNGAMSKESLVKLGLKKISLKVAGSLFEGDVMANIRLKAIDVEHLRLSLDKADVSFQNLKLSGDRYRTAYQVTDWKGALQLNGGEARFGEEPLEISTSVVLSADDGKPVLLHLLNAEIVPVDLTTVSSMRELRATTQMKIQGDDLFIDDLDLKSTTLKASGNLHIKNGRRFGRLKIEHALRNFDIKFSGNGTKLQ